MQRGHRALHPDAERAVPVLRQNPVRRPSRPRPLLSRAGREGRTRRRPGHGRAGSSPGRGPRKGRVTSYSGSKAGPLDPHQVAPVVAACAVTRAARCRESSSGCRARSVSASRIARCRVATPCSACSTARGNCPGRCCSSSATRAARLGPCGPDGLLLVTSDPD